MTAFHAPTPLRLLPAPLALFVLAIGLLGGLARLGLAVPETAATVAGLHGALTIACFFGTVISLERAVALDAPWTFVAPAAAALSGLVLIAGGPLLATQALQIVAASVLLAGSASLLRTQRPLYLLILALGALCWWLGNLVWIEVSLFAAVPWWIAFLVLTIAGERLELTRIRPLSNLAQGGFVIVVALIVAGALISQWQADAGLRLYAAGLGALALWLMRHDIARHTMQQRGLTRYIAVCLLCGYAWLLCGALLGLGGQLQPGAAWRDAAIHALTLGFVLSMVFGHAPIILPAVARLRVSYHPAFYLPLALLHGAVALRVAGNLLSLMPLRQAGGMLSVFALAIFIVTLITAVSRARRPAAAF